MCPMPLLTRVSNRLPERLRSYSVVLPRCFQNLTWKYRIHGLARLARPKTAWLTSGRLQSFLMPILHLAMVAMASRLASLQLRLSPTFIEVDRMLMPRFSDSTDKRCDHERW